MQITIDRLGPFLTAQFQAKITAIEPVGGGAWSQAFFFSAGGRRKVIRFSAFDEDFRKDHFAARYSSPSLPIPQIEARGRAFDGFFAVSNRIEGRMIDDLPPDEMRAAVPALMDLLCALQAVDGSQTRGYGGFDGEGNGASASWREYLTSLTVDSAGSRLQGWKNNLARDKAAADLYQKGRQDLLELISLCPEERHLIHNDLLHYNLIMRDNQVAGLIDWGCGLWGDFLYDLAMIMAWQFYYPALAGIDFAGQAQQAFAARGVALPHFRQRLQCYQIHLLLDSLAYNAWKQDQTNLDITAGRLREIMDN